jgi:hypothetical protein
MALMMDVVVGIIFMVVTDDVVGVFATDGKERTGGGEGDQSG